MACIWAYIVVGPTNRNPRFFKSLDKATDSGLVVMAVTAR